MTGRDFSYAYFVFPLRYRTPDKQCGPGRYRGLTAFASLSMAVSASSQYYTSLERTIHLQSTSYSVFLNSETLVLRIIRIHRVRSIHPAKINF
ncbi:hypothetical protein [Thiolapillus sp.]|uniref:hypothetical protein n=1 Tax=Thiolapillus sp. TaxID=2017437 RepID=UPI003AF93BBA